MRASPHPDQPPFLTAIQQDQHDTQVWKMENVANRWDAAPNPSQVPNQQGWGAWYVLPPILALFQGISYREITGYEGPSMMDGVQTDDYVHDDGSRSLRTWTQCCFLVLPFCLAFSFFIM